VLDAKLLGRAGEGAVGREEAEGVGEGGGEVEGVEDAQGHREAGDPVAREGNLGDANGDDVVARLGEVDLELGEDATGLRGVELARAHLAGDSAVRSSSARRAGMR